MKKNVDMKQLLTIVGGITLTVCCLAYAAWPFIRDSMESNKMAQATREWAEKEKAAGRSGTGALQVSIPNPNTYTPDQPAPAAQPAAEPSSAPPPPVEESQAVSAPVAASAGQARPVPETAPLTTEPINPFLTKDERELIKKRGALPELEYLTVNAIIYSPSGSRAVIDGRILSEGDIIDGKQIVRIEAEKVICKDAFREYMIRIENVVRERKE